ncbi:type II asparaginase [Paramyrothecium foliicola]|nr:type II asparaginase [Paramyrothecium foliicola]
MKLRCLLVWLCVLILSLNHFHDFKINDVFNSIDKPIPRPCFRGAWFSCLPKPKIAVLITGGTIGAKGLDPRNPTNYTDYSSISTEAWVNGIAGASELGDFHYETFFNKGSPDLSMEDMLLIARWIYSHRHEYHGFLLLGGSDTAAENLFLLDMVLKIPNTIIYVPAARPDSALSADGPLSFVQGAQIIRDPNSWGQGPLLVCNEKIWGPHLLYKRTTNGLDMFDSPAGSKGIMKGGKPHFWYGPREPTGRLYFDIRKLPSTKAPFVAMLYATETRSIVTSLFDPEVVAIAIMSQGAGSMPTAGRDMISDASVQNRNKSIVVCLKTSDGFVGYPMYGTGNWAIPGGFMDALRCRLVLKLAFMFKMDVEEIRSLFEVDALSARSHNLFIMRLHWFSFEQVIVQTKHDCESRLQRVKHRLVRVVDNMKRLGGIINQA